MKSGNCWAIYIPFKGMMRVPTMFRKYSNEVSVKSLTKMFEAVVCEMFAVRLDDFLG